MATDVRSAPGSKKMLWAGWIVSAIPVLMLLFSGVGKLVRPPAVLEGFAHLGWPERLILPIAILEIACTLVYLVPRTAVLGAILITGYLGGATATHVRLGEPFVLQVGFGMVAWLGLYLRDGRVRALIPLRSRA